MGKSERPEKSDGTHNHAYHYAINQAIAMPSVSTIRYDNERAFWTLFPLKIEGNSKHFGFTRSHTSMTANR
jgi:hypothetical protein